MPSELESRLNTVHSDSIARRSPMDFYPIIDCNSHELLTVDFAPTRDASGRLSTGTTVPPDVAALADVDCNALSGRERIPPPLQAHGESTTRGRHNRTADARRGRFSR